MLSLAVSPPHVRSLLSNAVSIEVGSSVGDVSQVVESRGWKDTGRGRPGLVGDERVRFLVEVFGAHAPDKDAKEVFGAHAPDKEEKSSGDECPLAFLSRVSSEEGARR